MLNVTLDSLGLETVRGDESFVSRVQDMPVSKEEFFDLKKMAKYVGVTEQFKDVINTFHTPEGETPAGFKRELVMEKDGVVKVDLVRDISYDKNGILRPTNVLFSADSANPYEVEPISPLISNLTCNPGIIYDLFINNPKANVGNKYKNRDEVMAEIGRVLGPGCDISVELNNPFEQDFNKILEEAEKFREMFSKYRVVIKVPHTGAVTPQNVTQLLSGNKKLDKRPDQVGTEDALRGHNLALKLHEHGFRVNFTLMFEPFQTMLAMQARPYFINTFLRHRLLQSQNIKKYVDMYEVSKDNKILETLKDYFISCDYYTEADRDMALADVLAFGKDLLKYRHFEDKQGQDGLDGMRHNYPDIDKLLTEPEFQDMNHKVVITAEPNYLARFTSTNQVISYQRRFMNAANGQS